MVETFQAEGMEEWEGACSVAVQFRKHVAKNLKFHSLLSSDSLTLWQELRIVSHWPHLPFRTRILISSEF